MIVALARFHSYLINRTQTFTTASSHSANVTLLLLNLAKAYSSLRLQLNPSKTEFIWFGAQCNLNKISPAYLSLFVDSSTVPCSTVVRDLGFLLDSELYMKQHISKVTSICYYHLRRLCQIRNYVSHDREIMIQLVMSLVISRIDYSNSVY